MPIDPKLKSIQDEWYKRLKDEGFIDIENDKEQLKYTHQKTIENAYLNKDFAEANFEKCSNFLNSCFVIDNTDANIWEKHTYGYSIRKIAKSLQINRATVEFRINKLKKICEFFNWLCDDNTEGSEDHGYDINT